MTERMASTGTNVTTGWVLRTMLQFRCAARSARRRRSRAMGAATCVREVPPTARTAASCGCVRDSVLS